MTVCQPTLKKVKTAVHQFNSTSVKGLLAVRTKTYLDFLKLELYFITITSFQQYQGAVVLDAQYWLHAADSMGELTINH